MIHANWISGHARKVEKLRRAGLWMGAPTGKSGRARCAVLDAAFGDGRGGDGSWASWAFGLARWTTGYVTYATGLREAEAMTAALFY